MKIIVAIDSFKGSLSSVEANLAAAEGVLDACPDAEVIQIPVSDGGEGWVEAFRAAVGGEVVSVDTCDPLGRPIVAEYLIKGETAVIEMARANGLTLLSQGERDVERTHTVGTGMLILDAIRRGSKEIIVGLGGSATCDYGQGMTKVMEDALSREHGWKHGRAQLPGIRFIAATDVRNPLLGPNGAAYVFAPQKGASREVVERREALGRSLVDAATEKMGYDCSEREGSGAAGGLGWAMMQFLGAEVVGGAGLLLNRACFNEAVQGADLIVTGEGSADRQTLMGKLPFEIMERGNAVRVPTCLMAGRVRDRQLLIDAGFCDVRCIHPDGLSLEESMRKETAKANIRQACHLLLRNRPS